MRRKYYQDLDPRILHCDPSYQRGVTNARDVRKMVESYNDDLWVVIVVSHRKDGSYWVIDGWHRTLAAKELGLETVECKVYEGLTIQEEAELFWQLDTKRKGLTGDDIFRGRLTAGDPIAVEIYAKLQEIGYNVAFSGHSPSGFRAWKTAIRLYERWGMPLLSKALRVLHRAWPEHENSAAATLLEGMVVFLHTYPEISEAELVRALRWTTPQLVITSSRELSRSLSWATQKATAQAILSAYNYRRSSRRLEDRLADKIAS